jgi:hypothetical protein
MNQTDMQGKQQNQKVLAKEACSLKGYQFHT